MFQISPNPLIRYGLSILYCLCLQVPVWAQIPEGSALELIEVAPGVFVRQGVQEDASAGNLGHIANIGFIVGTERVAVIDSGGSLAEGQALLRAIRRVTELPVSHVVLTHMHPDHVLGAGAFVDQGAVFVGHQTLADALARRKSFYLDALRRQLGELALGTVVVPPDLALAASEVRQIDLGGRVISVEAWPTAHTNNDVSVFDASSGTLWLSDLLFVERTPVLDGSVLGWMKVMDELAGREAARVVPGHGPVREDWRAALARQRGYWETVISGVREILKNNGTIREAVATVGLEEVKNWLLFNDYHGRNVTASFVELEWE